MSSAAKGRVLIVAGSDPSGGAGIQADIKTVTMLGGYASAAVSALTVQNTLGVSDILPVPAQFVADQMKAVLSDIGADCVKTGMLYSADVIHAVADIIRAHQPRVKLVIDPIMVSTSGQALLEADAIDAMKSRLFPLATVVTPNLPEASLLAGFQIKSAEDMARASEVFLGAGAEAVLMTGGHMDGSSLLDMLFPTFGEATIIESQKISTRHTHGTGCTLASAIAASLASGQELEEAFRRSHAFVRRALEAAPGFGAGNGPLGHAAAGND